MDCHDMLQTFTIPRWWLLPDLVITSEFRHHEVRRNFKERKEMYTFICSRGQIHPSLIIKEQKTCRWGQTPFIDGWKLLNRVWDEIVVNFLHNIWVFSLAKSSGKWLLTAADIIIIIGATLTGQDDNMKKVIFICQFYFSLLNTNVINKAHLMGYTMQTLLSTT